MGNNVILSLNWGPNSWILGLNIVKFKSIIGTSEILSFSSVVQNAQKCCHESGTGVMYRCEMNFTISFWTWQMTKQWLARWLHHSILALAFIKKKSEQKISNFYGTSYTELCILWTVWPDWVIYWTLGKFLKPLAAINFHKSLKFLCNFCKGVEIYHYSSEIIFGQLL